MKCRPGCMNQLKVSIQQSIIVLADRGWSQRRIARELAVDRATVQRHLRKVANAASNPALGSQGPEEAKPATNPALGLLLGAEANAASNPALGSAADPPPKPATNPTIGSRPGPPSLCAPFATEIEAGLHAGLSAKRIHQDLVRDDRKGSCLNL